MTTIHLAGLERWAKLFQKENVCFMLFSFHNLRSRQFPQIAKWLRELKASETENDPVSIMLDSGVFSLRQSNAPIADAILDSYVDSYLKFLEGPDGDLWDIVAEVDMPSDCLGDAGEVLLDGYDRVLAWRDQLYDIVGRRLMPVLMHELTIEEKEDICRDERFDWVAFPSVPNGTPPHEVIPVTQEHIAMAHRHGKKIHLFAQTNVQTNLQYLLNAESVDSTSWISGDKHGMTFIFQEGRLEALDHSSQYRRKFYKGYYGKIGCDWKKILGVHKPHWEYCEGPDSRTRGCDACVEQLHEIRRSAVIAWRKYQRYLYTRDPRRRNETKNTTPKPFLRDNPMNLEGKTRTISKGRGWKGSPLDSERNLTHDREKNLDTCKDLNRKISGETRGQEELDIPSVSFTGDDGHHATNDGDHSRADGICHVDGSSSDGCGVDTDSGVSNSSAISTRPHRKVGENDEGERVNEGQIESGGGETRGVSSSENKGDHHRKRGWKREAGKTNSDDLLPEKAPERTKSEIGGPLAEKPIEVDGMHLPVMNHGQPNMERLRKGQAGFVCDTCAIADTCPVSSHNGVCKLSKDWEGFDTRNADHIMGALSTMLDIDKNRTFMAMYQEQVQTGGQLDRRVSEQLDGFIRRAAKVVDLRMQLRPPELDPTASSGGTHIQAHNVNVLSARNEPSILTTIFGGPTPQAPSPVLEVVEASSQPSPTKKEES